MGILGSEFVTGAVGAQWEELQGFWKKPTGQQEKERRKKGKVREETEQEKNNNCTVKKYSLGNIYLQSQKEKIVLNYNDYFDN